jgi:hypothetical protein
LDQPFPLCEQTVQVHPKGLGHKIGIGFLSNSADGLVFGIVKLEFTSPIQKSKSDLSVLSRDCELNYPHSSFTLPKPVNDPKQMGV